jgi:DNA polymerase I
MWSHLKDKGIALPKVSWEKINQDILPVLRKMEKTGIKLDVKKMDGIAKEVQGKAEKLEKEVYKNAGEKFNINSPSQMAEILFEKLKLPTKDLKKTKTGISTAASELQKLESGPKGVPSGHKIIKYILEYRELSKLLSTYLKPLPLLVDKNSRLHTHYGQDTSTSRINSSEPNLQNIPIKGEWGEKIRSTFVAEEGMVLVAADYSQIELRVVACLAQDQSMLESFKKGEDIHTRTASEIFNIPLNKVTSAQRRVAKTVNFGVLYGQSPYGLAQTLGIDQKVAAEYINQYFIKHPGIMNYCNRMIDLAHKEGKVETLFGFTRALPNINSPYRNMADSEERMAINAPVQGTAAEVLKLAMIELDKKLESKKGPRMLLTVHDELVVESPKAMAPEISKLVKDIMENVIQLCIPLKAEVGFGENWAEAKRS